MGGVPHEVFHALPAAVQHAAEVPQQRQPLLGADSGGKPGRWAASDPRPGVGESNAVVGQGEWGVDPELALLWDKNCINPPTPAQRGRRGCSGLSNSATEQLLNFAKSE